MILAELREYLAWRQLVKYNVQSDAIDTKLGQPLQ